ncbi:MAG TPA: acyl-CoA dehydrogenase [Candidatus Baltobacteraceae bacterium]|nr:acyl-CoA dehydrogenase [Candidatus Baltobacteraceae bacterium]
MDFELSAEQLLLQDSVSRFAADHAGTSADPWKTFAQLGWLAVGTPEELGGFGGPTETLLLMEQFGRGLVRSAYVTQVVFAGTILRAAERLDLLEELTEGRRRFAVAYEEPHARYDPSRVDTSLRRDGNGWIVSGSKVRVLDPSSADTLIVSARGDAGIALVAVPAAAQNLIRHAYPAEDGSDVANLRFDRVRVDDDAILAGGADGLELLEFGIDSATAALCAEALGLCAVMLETTVGYTKERHQFGVPLSSFQALQHRMAEMYIELELLRSMAYYAAMTLQDERDPAARKRGISSAKAQVAKSGRFIGQQAIQLHGAIGMSEEYKIGGYFKRMTLVERLLGDRDYHLRRYVDVSYAAPREAVAIS